MGSGQSNPSNSVANNSDEAPTKTFDDQSSNTTSSSGETTRSKRAAAANVVVDPNEASLSGMPLVHYKCCKRKKVYDKCVSQWYSKEFLPGKSVDQEEACMCGDFFENYRLCVLKGIRKEIWEKQGLPPPKDGSPLTEVEDGE